MSGSWLLRAPFFALAPEENDHKRWNNTPRVPARKFGAAFCIHNNANIAQWNMVKVLAFLFEVEIV
jgi:hypothetical protein